jgi:leader peptidase (prepilin peptidase)/N-methyltransferase
MDFNAFLGEFFRNPLHYPWLLMVGVFLVGAVAGSFLNVCIARLPYQKSVFWPLGSHCGSCYQPIRFADNIPLWSYLRLKGKCRRCGAKYSSRYFWIELLTAVTFAALFYYDVVTNATHVGQVLQHTLPVAGWQLVVIWAFHAVFFCFLIVATFVDIEVMEISPWVTVPGTIVGIIAGTLAPWPWPVEPATIEHSFPHWQGYNFGGLTSLTGIFPLPAALQRWPVWMPLPEWLPPGSWQLGLVTSLVGAAVGTGLIRGIRFVFGWGLGKEAMGLGDADLMMMIGAFLGWQAIFLVLGFAVFLGLFYAVLLIIRNKAGELPFGPFLAGGAALVVLANWIFQDLNAAVQPLFFDANIILLLGSVFVVLAFVMAMCLRMLRLIAQAV